MSLLRNTLKKNTAQTESQPADGLSDKAKKSLFSIAHGTPDRGDHLSVKSSGGVTVSSVRSIAESVASFATALLGGKRVPKRRRPEVSRLGAPKWYDRDPPEAPEMPGTEKTDILQKRFTVAHAHVREQVGDDPYLAVLLYNYAQETSRQARYYDDTKITGELRLQLDKPDSIVSVDVWCLAKVESSFGMLDAYHVQYHANLWDKADSSLTPGGSLSVGKMFIFPFEFDSLPKDCKVHRPDSTVTAMIPLPPTYYSAAVGSFWGSIKYYIGVNIKRENHMALDEIWDVPFQYYPLRRPIARERTVFPFIPHREDWPYSREEIGGWTVTPFGGRGRFKDEIVEIEGLLGVQAPEVYTAGETLHYSLLLWSKSIPALEALTNLAEADIDVVFASSDVFGTDVLHPTSAARKNRVTKRLAQGRVWHTDDGPPVGDEMPALREGPKIGKPTRKDHTSDMASPSSAAANKRSVHHSHLQEVMTVVADESNEDEGEDTVIDQRSPSPSSDEHVDPLDRANMIDHIEGTVRLDGDLRVPSGLLPNFRYKWMGREYMLHITFTHPEYSHISPSATSIYAETPLWIVLGKSHRGVDQSGPVDVAEDVESGYLSNLPVVGESPPDCKDAVRAAMARGGPTSKMRPIIEGPRYGF